jgi:putative spermidine/putrescine transport system ATP-binding protein
VQGTVESHEGRLAHVRLDSGRVIRVAVDSAASGRVFVSVRPERIVLKPDVEAGENAWPAKVLDSVYQGDHVRVQLGSEAGALIARLGRGEGEWAPQSRVTAAFAPADCWVIPA